MKKVILLVALAVVLVLIYQTVMSVLRPVNFDKEQAKREVNLQKQLKAIATLQDAFEDVNGRYATADELKNFLETGKIYYVKAEGTYTDAMRDRGLTEAEAARQGLIQRDTVWVSAKDSLLKNGTFDALMRVNDQYRVQIDTASISQVVGLDTIAQSVFQAVIPFEAYLGDLDKARLQEKIEAAKAKANGYPGLRIGSLNEVKMTGNWE